MPESEMKTHLEKIGGLGAIIAAAACPVCFPKLALLGALFGLGALSAYESQLFIAAQVLVALAVLRHVLAYLQHRRPRLLGLGVLSGAAVFGGLYLFGSEALIYVGLAGLAATSATDFWVRRRGGARSFKEPATSPLLESVITCPKCGHRKQERMPTDTCQFFTSVQAAALCCARRRAVAASFARTVRSSVRRCSSPAPDRGERHGSESKAVAAIGAAADRSFSGAQGELRVLEEVPRFYPQQHAHHAKETEAGEGVQPALPGDLGSE